MEGIVGFDYTGDIALDDLALVPGGCPGKCLTKSDLHVVCQCTSHISAHYYCTQHGVECPVHTQRHTVSLSCQLKQCDTTFLYHTAGLHFTKLSKTL